MNREDFLKQYKDPRWQKRRLQILERDDFCCRKCDDPVTTLHVHHIRYLKGKPPWESPDKDLTTLCQDCHEVVSYHKLTPEEFRRFRVVKFWDSKTEKPIGFFHSLNGGFYLRVEDFNVFGTDSVGLLKNIRSLINHTINNNGQKDD